MIFQDISYREYFHLKTNNPWSKRDLMENQIFNAISRFHVLDLIRKHHLIRFANLSHNIDE